MTTERDDQMLDAGFARMRNAAQDVIPSDALLDRIMADADSMLAAPRRAVTRRPVALRLLDMIGGWPAFGGLAAATLAGVWIGLVQPDAISGALWAETIEVPLLGGDVFAGLDG